ncbi:MAG: hypothetical protein JW894_00705 [Bacteroidales bacterium]|nr:hypothetical protein [Bacteroidales bacterium]
MAIRYIRQKDINYSLWDRCINYSLNGVIYAQSWFLDIVAKKWDALVEDDYKTVMPLTFHRKFLHRELFNPPFAKQLGIFSEKPLNHSKIEKFMNHIPIIYRKLNICFNRHNSQSLKLPDAEHKYAYELDLITPYEKKSKLYSKKLRTQLEQAHQKRFSVVRNISLYEFESFVVNCNDADNESHLFKMLRQILSRLTHTGKAEITGVYNYVNELDTVACFVKSNNNVVLFYGKSKNNEDSVLTVYLLIDDFLRTYSGRNVTLSLEHFDKYCNEEIYSEFGAIKCSYICFSQNKLPYFLKWMK